MEKCRQHSNHLEHISRLAEDERLRDNAVESERYRRRHLFSLRRAVALPEVPPGAPRKDQCGCVPLDRTGSGGQRSCFHNFRLSIVAIRSVHSIVAIRSVQDNAQTTSNNLKQSDK